MPQLPAILKSSLSVAVLNSFILRYEIVYFSDSQDVVIITARGPYDHYFIELTVNFYYSSVIYIYCQIKEIIIITTYE